MSGREDERDAPIGAAIRAAAETVQAPPRLREAVARERAGRRRRAWRAAALAAAASVAVAIALVAGLSPGGGPSVEQVAQAALRAPTQPAPAGDGRFLDAEVGGVRLPDFERRFGWRTVGLREDRVDGRAALTAIYRRGDVGVHYTIVAGVPLPPPGGARRVDAGGVPVALVRDDGALVATWERDGRTCVLASRTAGERLLLAMVAW